MQSELDVNFNHNLDVLIQFPKDNNYYAEINKDSEGKLSCYNGRFFGSFFNPKLKELVEIINRTCEDLINETGRVLNKAKESGNLTDAKQAQEFYEKVETVLESVKEINRVYTNRNKNEEGLEELGKTIGSLQGELNQFWRDEKHTELLESGFIELESSGDIQTSQADMGSTIETERGPQQSNSWFATYGKGPTAIGNFISGFNTVKELAIGSLFPYVFTPSQQPISFAGQQRVANGGRQLGGADVHCYIEGINKSVKVNAIHNFHLMIESEINNKTLEEIKSILNNVGDFQHPEYPLIIPVAFGGEGIWERNHIAVILIKDNHVEYYDAKGVLSENRSLAQNSGTLRDVLEFCRNKFAKEGVISENPYPHQYDSHNCGVFICRHLHNRLLGNGVMGDLKTEAPSLQEVENFRQEIIQVAYPVEKKEEEKGQKFAPSLDQTSLSEDDF